MYRRSVFYVVSFLFLANFCWWAFAEESFVLATFNIRRPGDKSPHSWRERRSRCLEIIRKNKIDIYGIQEGYSYQVKDLLDNGLYQYTGGGRNDFKNKGEFCAILYKKERFELLKGGIFGLSEKPHIPNYRSWKSAYPRIASWGIFKDKKNGKTFIYYNTHLDNVRPLARINGLQVIIDHAKKNAKGLPIILSGDLNASKNSETWKKASSFLNDAAILSRTVPTGPGYTYHGYGKEKSTAVIDFIFVSDLFTVLTHKICDTHFSGAYASDHYPVITRLRLK